MPDTALRTSLLDLFHVIGPAAKGIYLGGGYGLYLKQMHLASTGERTLIPANLWPAPRATEDLDLLLTTEIVASPDSMRALRQSLDSLGYQVVEEAKFLQFIKPLKVGHVKVDLLTSQLDILKAQGGVQADSRRARPKGKGMPELHAHPTQGALGLNEHPTRISVAGLLSSGKAVEAGILIPPPYAYALMKLTAYRDRRSDPNKGHGRHHALDLFRIIAMMTEAELKTARDASVSYRDNQVVQECRALVANHFAATNAPGIIAMREHQLWQNDDALATFIETIIHIV
jgi:hypothetical protein